MRHAECPDAKLNDPLSVAYATLHRYGVSNLRSGDSLRKLKDEARRAPL
jgi:hypothetical protein